MTTAVLIGGSWDGAQVKVKRWQKIYYTSKKISIEELENLKIDGVMYWRCPDEVYEKKEDGNFHYTETVNYKP